MIIRNQILNLDIHNSSLNYPWVMTPLSDTLRPMTAVVRMMKRDEQNHEKKMLHLFSLMVLGNSYLALALSLNNKERRRISYTHRHCDLGITVGGPGRLAFFYPVIIIKSMTHRNFNKRGIRFLCAVSSLLLTAIKFYSNFF